MGSKSDYLENKLLDHALGQTSFTMPTNVYLALCTTAPTDASTGSTIVEANYTGYARKDIKSSLAAASSGETDSNADIVFADCTAGSSDIVGFAICDASTGGNVLYWGTMTSKTIDTSNTPATVKSGDLQITED